VVTDPQHSSPALDTIVRYALALKLGNEDFQKELRGVHKATIHYQKEIDKLRARLGQPPLYKKLDEDYDVHQDDS
jgi:hypothetical protein